MTHAQFKVGDEVILILFDSYTELDCYRGCIDRVINESKYYVIEDRSKKMFFGRSRNMLPGASSKEEVIAKAKAYLEELFLEPMVAGPLERIFS